MSFFTELFEPSNNIIPFIGIATGLALMVSLIANTITSKLIERRHKERLKELERLKAFTKRADELRKNNALHLNYIIKKEIEQYTTHTDIYKSTYDAILIQLESHNQDKPFTLKYPKELYVYSKIIKNRKIISFNHFYYSAIDSLFSEGLIKKEKKKTNTIVGLMLEEKANSAYKINLYLFGAIAIQIIGSYFGFLPFSIVTSLVPAVLLIALHLDQIIVSYRIRKGWYGKNRSEAREIISFILSHANKDDFNDDGGLKELIDKPETPSPTQIGYNGGEVNI